MELNEKWKEQAEIENDKIEYDERTTLADEFKNGFIKGAQTYADSVEKMLRDEIPNSKAQEPFIKYLLTKLKSIQP